MTAQVPSVGDYLDTAEQLVTISAVLLGALTMHVTSYLMERQRNRHERLTRWDTAKLDAYEGFVDRSVPGFRLPRGGVIRAPDWPPRKPQG